GAPRAVNREVAAERAYCRGSATFVRLNPPPELFHIHYLRCRSHPAQPLTFTGVLTSVAPRERFGILSVVCLQPVVSERRHLAVRVNRESLNAARREILP